mgnify:CR=1 FL=1
MTYFEGTSTITVADTVITYNQAKIDPSGVTSYAKYGGIAVFVIFAGTTDNEDKSIPPASFIALFLDITPP